MSGTKTYIYVLDNIRFVNDTFHTYEIGACDNPLQRIYELQPALPEQLEIVKIYETLNKTAYFVDALLKFFTTERKKYLKLKGISIFNYDPQHIGGTEHYIVHNLEDIERFFDFTDIKYKLITDYSIFSVNIDKCEPTIDESVVDEYIESVIASSKTPSDENTEKHNGGASDKPSEHATKLQECIETYPSVNPILLTELSKLCNITYFLPNSGKNNSKLIVDFDSVCELLGTTKGNLKQILTRNFTEKTDYSVERLTKTKKSGGTSYNKITITPMCFKGICLTSQCAKAKEFRKCFMELEK